MDLMQEKITILFSMLVATFCFALLPWKLHQIQTRTISMPRLLSWLQCFSGGVFLAACLMDLFPDVHEAVDHVLDEIERVYHTTIDYPMAEFIIVVGFLIVLVLEQMVLEFQTPSSTPQEPSTANSASTSAMEDDEEAPLLMRRLSEDHDHGHHHLIEHSSLRSVLLTVALSFHSIFEGLAIGLQEDKRSLVNIFTAVIVHKAIMALSLGLTVAKSPMSFKSFLLSVSIFSLASPIGMAIGIVLTDIDESIGRDIANSILQGIAGGTFLYIVFFEVLQQEFTKPTDRMPKLFFTVVGFGCICGLLFITH